MVHHLSVDIETFSSVDIKKAGLYRYAQAPDFQILLFAYSLDGAPVEVLQLCTPGGDYGKCPDFMQLWLIDALKSPDYIKHAYNAAFEWYCLCRHFGWNPMQEGARMLSQWRCTQLQGLYCGYPMGLSAVGTALGLPADKRKQATGSALIRYFCTPCKPSRINGGRTRNLPHHDPEKWRLFVEYNRQDVVTEMEVAQRFTPWPVPPALRKQWETDQIINARGVAVDLDLMDGAIQIGESTAATLRAEAVAISGLDNPNSIAQLSKWLTEEMEQEIGDVRKDTVKELLATGVESDKARRMLEIRQELGKTSTKKYNAMETAVCEDGRVRGLLQFYGANRTGRWAGRLVQVQNLPRTYIEPLPLARDLVKGRKADALEIIYGSIPDTLSQLIRTAFIPAPGNTFVDADFSAIEARVIAWLAGESWVLDVFRTHGKIYEATASQMFGVPIERIKKGTPDYALRQKGKVATLALGYQGGVNALIAMGALTMGLTEEELPEIVSRWRQSNRRIVEFWYTLERAAVSVIQSGRPCGVGRLMMALECSPDGAIRFLTVTLPNGRKLFYAKPFLGPNRFGGESIHYFGMDQTSKKWKELETYGGKLAENITQATARDGLAEAVERLEDRGFPVVFHVHDEVVIDAKKPDLDAVCSIMAEPVPWAIDLPLKADGWADLFYKKD